MLSVAASLSKRSTCAEGFCGFFISSGGSIGLEEIATDAVVGRCNKGNLATIGALSFKDIVETSTIDEIDEIAIVVVITLEIGEHRGVVVGFGKSCLHEVVVGAGGEPPHEEEAAEECSLFDAMYHKTGFNPSEGS